MRLTFRSALTTVFLAMASVAVADPMEDGKAAYQRNDYATALQVWRPLADRGLAAAQFDLAAMYANGKGVVLDSAEALKWYRLAADQGYAEAQFTLGVMYDQGQSFVRRWGAESPESAPASSPASGGVASLPSTQPHSGQIRFVQQYSQITSVDKDSPRVGLDDILAHMWLNLASAKGYQGAAKARDIVAKRMSPTQIAEAQWLAREWRPTGVETATKEGIVPLN